MLETFFKLWETVAPVLVPILATVGGATSISIWTPNSSVYKIIDILLKLLNALSGNVKNNKNA